MAKSKNTQFAVAVHLLTYLAGVPEDRVVSSDELSESTNVNPVYIRRVLGPLREAALVWSRPGVHGGWGLAVDPGQITLGKVWRLLQGGDPVLGLHGPDPACPVGRVVQQSLRSLDDVVADAIASELEKTTVWDLHVQGKTATGQLTRVGALSERRQSLRRQH